MIKKEKKRYESLGADLLRIRNGNPFFKVGYFYADISREVYFRICAIQITDKWYFFFFLLFKKFK